MREKVLIIDDEDDIRKMTGLAFSLKGYQVVLADNGMTGLELIYRENPDIVVTDVNMPIMDGFQLCEKIRNDIILSHMPIIMLTARREEVDQIKGLSLGVDDYLTKPYSTYVLLAKVENLLKRTKQSLDANPLTKLPGNTVITKKINELLHEKVPFAFFYVDLNNFKPFNDYYGYAKGDEVIRMVADVLSKALSQYKTQISLSFLGHVGGDDFVILTDIKIIELMAKEIINQFDIRIKDFYSQEDLKNGFIVVVDRSGNKTRFSVIGLAIAITSSLNYEYAHFGELNSVVAELKKQTKKNQHSSYLIDRRVH